MIPQLCHFTLTYNSQPFRQQIISIPRVRVFSNYKDWKAKASPSPLLMLNKQKITAEGIRKDSFSFVLSQYGVYLSVDVFLLFLLYILISFLPFLLFEISLGNHFSSKKTLTIFHLYALDKGWIEFHSAPWPGRDLNWRVLLGNILICAYAVYIRRFPEDIVFTQINNEICWFHMIVQHPIFAFRLPLVSL